MENLNVKQNEEQLKELTTNEFDYDEQTAELDQQLYPGFPGYGQYPYGQYPWYGQSYPWYGYFPWYGHRPWRRRPWWWYGQYPYNQYPWYDGWNIPYTRGSEESEFLDIETIDEVEEANIQQRFWFGFGYPFWRFRPYWWYRPWWGFYPWGPRWW
ncbi:hypothetical protein [Tepidibacillus sp. LV47]|uniref:hypothetical protein n=1 Tax=Tepidibacillus sp. LV47 TaxID=3398228 RepID=UPI003AAE2276